ncbi:hypothetical protein JW968_05910 [Candidatus Woesearchaeota archaeon]|nr:hypothetical protein [Candidatus Woesearchaeota archaeon]
MAVQEAWTVHADEVWQASRGASCEVWLKMEPLILHVACRSIPAADRLVKKANSIGLKRAGAVSLSPKTIVERLSGTISWKLRWARIIHMRKSCH